MYPSIDGHKETILATAVNPSYTYKKTTTSSLFSQSTHKPPTKQMMQHSMATTTNNAAGGSKNHLSSSQHGSAYGQAYYSQNSGEPSDANDNVMPIVFVAITGVVVLLRILWCGLQKDDAEEQVAGGGDRVGPPSSQAAGLADRDPSMVAAVEVPPVRGAEPPLVCTYRKADGWREGSYAGCAWQTSRTEWPSGCCRRACTTSTPPAPASGCARTLPARSAAPRSPLPPTTPPRPVVPWW